MLQGNDAVAPDGDDRPCNDRAIATPTICFYDLDRTVTRLPTWTAFLLRTAWARHPWRLLLLPLVLVAAIGRAAGWIGRDRLKEIMHGALLGRDASAADIRQWSERFADNVAARGIRPGALARIAADRAAGHRIVMATAAHRFYADPIARRLRIGDVIATEAVRRDGRVTNRIDGANVYGAAKLAAVEAWLAAQGLARGDVFLWFYSDHASDRPCLAYADRGVAINPGARMRALAARHGWPSFDWNMAASAAD